MLGPLIHKVPPKVGKDEEVHGGFDAKKKLDER
jgi:hypothetical protein